MKFFNASDFELVLSHCDKIADRANEKMEKEGEIVYSNELELTNVGGRKQKYLLIKIDPIEKCKHPKEKITYARYVINEWHCSCGAKVKPSVFVEV